jgi:hypothetical protein
MHEALSSPQYYKKRGGQIGPISPCDSANENKLPYPELELPKVVLEGLNVESHQAPLGVCPPPLSHKANSTSQ